MPTHGLLSAHPRGLALPSSLGRTGELPGVMACGDTSEAALDAATDSCSLSPRLSTMSSSLRHAVCSGKEFAMRRELCCSMATVAVALVSACVTTHQGTPVKPKGQEFLISCTENDTIEAERFLAVACTIENKSDDWVELAVSSFDFVPAAKAVRVSTPEEVSMFVDAYRFQKAKEDANTSAFLAGIAAVGAVAMSSPNSTTAAAGTGMVAGAAAAAAAQRDAAAVSAAQHGNLGYGTEHLLSGPFKVPPRMFTRKQILVEAPRKLVESSAFPDTIRVCLTLPTTDCIKVPYKNRWRSTLH